MRRPCGIVYPVTALFFVSSPNQFFGEVVSSQIDEPQKNKICASIVARVPVEAKLSCNLYLSR